MKIKINTDQHGAFLKAVTQATKISDSRTTLPVLTGLLLTAQKDHLSIQAHNLDQAILFTFPVEVKEEGKLGLVGSDLLHIASLSKSLELESDKSLATVKCGGTFKLPVLIAEDFPPLPEMEKKVPVDFTSAELARAMSVVYAASPPNSGRYQIQGVCLNPAGKQGVATNGALMALSSFPIESGDFGPIIPEKAAHLITALSKQSDGFDVAFTDAWLSLRGEGVTFYTKLIEGNYPNFKQIMAESVFAVKVNRKGLIEALDRAMVAQSETNRVHLKLSKSTLLLSVIGKNAESETSLDLEEKAPAKAVEFEIACSSVYLRETASFMTEEVISLGFTDNLSPLIIQGGGYAILMPIRTT